MYNSVVKTGLLTLMAAVMIACMPLERIDIAKARETSSGVTTEKVSLGQGDLSEKRETNRLANGVTHTEIKRGERSPSSYFTIDVGFYETKDETRSTVKKLREDGYKAWIHSIKGQHYKATDVPDKVTGHVVRTGKSDGEDEAVKLLEKVKNDGYEKARVTYSEYDGTIKTTGPWEIDVIEINPQKFEGRLTNGLANDQIAGRETLSSMSKRKNALAAINGGYFVVGQQDGVPGDPAGISVMNGQLISESVGERTSLILSGKDIQIGNVKTNATIMSGKGENISVDGINRKPGLIRSCGGIGDEPTINPMHDVTCFDDNELIQFNRSFSNITPAGKGFEVILNESDIVIATKNNRGSEIPGQGTVLSATGEKAEWLKKNAVIGEKLSLNNNVSVDGEEIDLTPDVSMINGAPRLLKNGMKTIPSDKEGFHWSADFFYHFGLYRHPRTLVGVKENGNILLVTVDGRNPDRSIGINFHESAELLKSLGAVDGMNLDGGGSTTMFANDRIVNVPSDKTNERPIADGIFIVEK
ncbi:phosphodiester glycosidase family protein [Pseudalkalibacillus sp. A8]|uniref:phosphodiester glycosidase family protein n=1 Tax=Pseudalkalibacillus sp. A8 TaxID=3382641 RepID=UPI0038B5EB03